ncbi:MAG: hypothetical protein IH851_07510 [Armatimonadetes bacterium]|nr:hypothetical protein [Armatimonadota bacterium]
MIQELMQIALITCTAQLFSPNVAWPYPADRYDAHIRDLAEADVIAVVRVSAPSVEERRPQSPIESSAVVAYPTCRIDTFEVLDCPVGGLSGTVRSVFDLPASATGFPAPDPSGTYLLVAFKPVERKLIFTNFSPQGSNPLIQYAVPLDEPNEVSGVLLLRTNQRAVIVAQDPQATILLSIAAALGDANDDAGRRVTDILSRLRMHKEFEDSEEQLIGGINSHTWVKQVLGPAIEGAAATASPYTRARAIGLLYRWGLFESAEPYLQALEQADAAGSRFDHPLDGRFFNRQRGLDARTRPSTERLIAFAASVNTMRLKSLAVTHMDRKPNPGAMRTLVGMLSEDNVFLRFRLLDKFARWAKREDLRPLWMRDSQGRRSWETRQIEREQELIRHWRGYPPE